jgi:hydroxymethylbilane synthase
VDSPSDLLKIPSKVRIGTRKSELAQLQTAIVSDALRRLYPAIVLDIVFVTTRGDKVRDRPIAELGTRGVFVKELEEALLDHEVDLVIHSLKDLPTDIPQGLCLTAVLDRADPRDVLISRNKTPLMSLPAGSKVATSSRRRSAQLRHLRDDLEFIDIRGNVPTRIKKHDDGHCDAIVLAAAGLQRLKLEHRITEYFSFDQSTPAAGQGALAIECRTDNAALLRVLQAVEDTVVRAQITSERAFLERLGGGCSVPIGAIAESDQKASNGSLRLVGCVASIDGKRLIRKSMQDTFANAHALGLKLADEMLTLGAGDLLADLRQIPASVSPP